MLGLLLVAFAVRAQRPLQPIVENYVGRQVPTAMVARNLDRGSGFFRPQLDTLPVPNLFLVEPPLYEAAVVLFRRVTGASLTASGRLVSDLGIVLGAWGLFGLVRRREGSLAALGAVGAFAVFPIAIRYGRSFQPDALMLGTLLASLRAWDSLACRGGTVRLALGWIGIALGLALKITSAYIIIPLLLLAPRRGTIPAQRDESSDGCPIESDQSGPALRHCSPDQVQTAWLAVAALAPALLWYAYTACVLMKGGGSRASAENGTIWLQALVPSALGRRDTLELIGRFLFLRAFTPFGLIVGLVGVLVPGGARRFWLAWGGASLLAMLLLAAKLHHEYYWLALAPVVAAGIGRSLSALWIRGAWGRGLAGAIGLALVAGGLYQSRATFQTPPQWATLQDAAREVDRHVPADAWVVAPEALLFEADRRGCRLELSPVAAQRAVREWGASRPVDSPIDLVEFYKGRGARYFADAGGVSPVRLALHAAVRRRYNVLVDRPGILVATLSPPEPRTSPDGTRPVPRQPARLRPLETRRPQDQRPDRLRLHDGPPPR